MKFEAFEGCFLVLPEELISLEFNFTQRITFIALKNCNKEYNILAQGFCPLTTKILNFLGWILS